MDDGHIIKEWVNGIITFLLCAIGKYIILRMSYVLYYYYSPTHTTNLLDNALQKNTLLGSKTASCVESVSVTEKKVIRKRVRWRWNGWQFATQMCILHLLLVRDVSLCF